MSFNNVKSAVVGDIEFPVADGELIEAGMIVLIDAGYAKPGEEAASKWAPGIAKKTIDNTDGGDGDEVVIVETGWSKSGGMRLHWLKNSATDPVVAATVGGLCYVEDQYTVSIDDSGTTPAGRVMRLDSTLGVLVHFNT